MSLPKYLSWTGCGSSCGEPPGVFTGATMHLFGISTSGSAMQDLVDKLLNPVTGLSLEYKVLANNALLTFVDIQKGTAATEAIGWLPGRECALWIPLLETRLLSLKTRPVMWCPYIFINYGIGMATGREVWGWSKALGDIDFPAPADPTPRFALDTVIFRDFDPAKPGGKETLLKLTGTAPLGTGSVWPTLGAAATALITKLIGVAPAPLALPMPGVFDFPAIALKQFRDSNTPEFACYQAIVNSPVRIRNFLGGGLHPGSFKLEVATCDSHPIVDKFLGKAASPGSTVVNCDWGAWVKMDFDALPGSVIAKTT